MGLPKTLRGWALTVFAALWSLFVAVVVVGFLTAWAAQHHWFDNPDQTVSHIATWLWGVASNPAFIWPTGLLLGLSAGFAGGVWLDSLQRRKNLVARAIPQVAAIASATPAPAPKPGGSKPSGPQLGSWMYVDRFKVSEAANLWADYLPSGSYMFDKAQRPAVVGAERLLVSELNDAFDFRDAPTHRGPGDFSDAYVLRKDLLALAERLKVRPVFLYPNG